MGVVGGGRGETRRRWMGAEGESVDRRLQRRRPLTAGQRRSVMGIWKREERRVGEAEEEEEALFI